MNMRIAAILLLGYCAGMSTPAFAQKKDKLKKGPNISLNISAKKDSVKTTYLNIGLLTNIYQLKGIGYQRCIQCCTKIDMTGFQISGLASVTGRHASGFQLGGMPSVAGGNANEHHAERTDECCRRESQRYPNFRIRQHCRKHIKRSYHRRSDGIWPATKAQGVQIAGLANIAGKSQNGVAIGGLMNVSAEKLNRAQVSTLLNISGGEAKGAQVSAIGNVV